MHGKKQSRRQFKVILNELERFEQKLVSREAVDYDDDNMDLSGGSSSGNHDGASSCSFEDIDTEVVREIYLSPNKSGEDGGYSSEEIYLARGIKHVDSLKTSTVYENFAEEMSPGSLDSPQKESCGNKVISVASL